MQLLFQLSSLLIFLPLVLLERTMVATQFRRFWHKFKSAADFKSYLESHQDFMAYAELMPAGQFQWGLKLENGDNLFVADAISQLQAHFDHSLIIVYSSAAGVNRPWREYAAYNETPQIWSYFPLAGGPLGSPVDNRATRGVMQLDFTDNRIAAVCWTRGSEMNGRIYPPNGTRYNKSHIMDMADTLKKKKPNQLFVVVFDAILLSNTPQVIQWIPDHMANLPAMIRLHNFNMHESVNVRNLYFFVNQTKMWPFFFDLPIYIHYALIKDDLRFTTLPPKDFKATGWRCGGTGWKWLVYGLIGEIRRRLFEVN